MLMDVTLSPSAFERAFPFYFVMDAELTVTSRGPSLAKLLPALRPGVGLTEHLRLRQPDGPLSFERLRASENELVVFDCALRGVSLHGQVIVPTDDVVAILAA